MKDTGIDDEAAKVESPEKPQGSTKDLACGCFAVLVVVGIVVAVVMFLFGCDPFNSAPVEGEDSMAVATASPSGSHQPSAMSSPTPAQTSSTASPPAGSQQPTATPLLTPTQTPQSESTTVQALAAEVMNEYLSNELRADAIYNYGKNGGVYVEIVGVVKSIDGSKVRLRGTSTGSGPIARTYYDIICEGSEEWVASRTQPIDPGMELRVLGEGAGIDIYNDFVVRNCLPLFH